MTGKALTKNLIAYLSPLFGDLPIHSFDSNEKRPLPCLIVGYEAEEQSGIGLFGNYTVSGFVAVAINGHDDPLNAFADTTTDAVVQALLDRDALAESLNAPDVPEDDSRPANSFHLNRLFVRGTEREEQDSSVFVYIRFEAFTAAKDFY